MWLPFGLVCHLWRGVSFLEVFDEAITNFNEDLENFVVLVCFLLPNRNNVIWNYIKGDSSVIVEKASS